MSEWQLLADLAFSDLLLWVPIEAQADEDRSYPEEWICVAQVRPTTGTTAHVGRHGHGPGEAR